MTAKSKTHFFLPVNLAKIFIPLLMALMFGISAATGDSASYFYDDQGRLTRVVNGTSGTVYNYDGLGNMVSVTSAAITNASPVITGINPNILFVGQKLLVTITGQNLFTTTSVASKNGLVDVRDITVTDTRITAEMTAPTTGTDTIVVTTVDGTPNTAQVNVTLSPSRLSLSPGQTAIAPGASGSITASVSPSLAGSITINLNSSDPAVATVPQMVTIPSSGSASFTVNGLAVGNTTISAGDPESAVFVTYPFSGTVLGLTAGNVSVYIAARSGPSPAVASPVSVYVGASSGSSPIVSGPVSAVIDAPPGQTPIVSGPVSAVITAPPGQSSTVANPVSVYVNAPSGSSPITAPPVSAKIQ